MKRIHARRARAVPVVVATLCTAVLLGGCSDPEGDQASSGGRSPRSAASDPSSDGPGRSLLPQRATTEVIDAEGRRFVVDAALDRAAREALTGTRGAVVVLDAATGRVLAMVDSPSAGPTSLHGGSGSRVTATQETFSPGGIFTLVTAAAALQSGKYRADTATNFEAPMRYPESVRSLTDPVPGCTGKTLSAAFNLSCATVFAGIGNELGDDAVRAQAEKFGFNDFGKATPSATKGSLNIPLAVTPSTYPTHEAASQTMTASLGYSDVRATPLQMAMVAASIANQGALMRPYLHASGTPETGGQRLGQPVTPDAAAQLAAMMVENTRNGAARNTRVDAVSSVGAKCGATAYERTATPRPFGWCVAFADLEASPIAVAVLIEDPAAAGALPVPGSLAAVATRHILAAAAPTGP